MNENLVNTPEQRTDVAIDNIEEINVNVEDVEEGINSVKTSTDNVKTSADNIKTSVDATKSAIDTVNTNLGTLEVDVEAVNTTLTNSLIKTSTLGGTQKLTISDNVAVGANQTCKSCLIHVPTGNSGDVHLTIANETADANDFLLPKNQAIPQPIDNLSDLHFYGSNNSDVIYIIWRN